MKKLRAKVKTLEAAEDAVVKELQRLYPMGSAARLWLMYGQIGGRHAYVLIRLESRTREVRSVSAANIVSCAPRGEIE